MGFATKRPQIFICSFYRSKDDFIAASACCNLLITASFRTGSAQNRLYIQLSVELTQRNKVIAKLQCPSFFSRPVSNSNERNCKSASPWLSNFMSFVSETFINYVHNSLMSDEYVYVHVCVYTFPSLQTVCILCILFLTSILLLKLVEYL